MSLSVPAVKTKKSKGSLGLLAIGVDYHAAPVELREKVAYNQSQAEELLARLVATPEIDEACLVSTCNRTELYLKAHDGDGSAAGDAASGDPGAAAYRKGLEMTFLSRAPEIEDEGRFFVKRDEVAARHLMEVASGLQSMVLGEPEILGQIKQANGYAEALGTTGVTIKKLLRTAISTGGRARSETAIGHGAVSFGYAVVDLARNIFQSLEGRTVLMVGAGEMARSVARSLTERGASRLIVANRGVQRAHEFREVFPQAEIVPFDERYDALAEADIAVASTGAKEPVLLADGVAAAMKRRPSRLLLLADLGVPRNIASPVGDVENVFLQDIDSLEVLINRNLKKRRDEVPKVERILERELARFVDWYRSQASEPVIARLHRRAEQTRRDELQAVLDRFPDDCHEDLERLTKALVRKVLHHPSRQLRSADPQTAELVQELFQLDEDT